jgi:hypothetical protein
MCRCWKSTPEGSANPIDPVLEIQDHIGPEAERENVRARAASA